MIKLSELINEMPHYSDDSSDFYYDLGIEKYPLSDKEKKDLFNSYKNGGLIGFHKNTGKWLLFSDKGVKEVQVPTDHDQLPDYWEEYVHIKQ